MRRNWALAFAVLVLWLVPLFGQQREESPGTTTRPQPQRPPQRQRTPGQQRTRTPFPPEQRQLTTVIINGRVRAEAGPIAEQVRVEFWNRGRVIRSVFTDVRGNFTITIDERWALSTSGAAIADASVGSAQTQTTLAGFENIGFRDSRDRLAALVRGGEIRVSVSGYYPISKHFMGPVNTIGFNDVGTITLQRLAKVDGTSISTTSLAAPKKARKAYSKAAKLLQKNRLEEAETRLLKAVEIYPQYAVAWNTLGGIYRQKNQPEKALQAFSEAVKADPKYIRPYLGRAEVELAKGRYQEVVNTTGTLLRLDPTFGIAHFYKAVGHYSLQQLRAAEQSARASLKSLHRPPPAIHFLMGTLLARKGTYPEAVQELQAFLKVEPDSPQAERARKLLAELEARLPTDSKVQARSGEEAD